METQKMFTCSGLLDKERHSRGKTRQWIKRRETHGFFQNIVRELIAEDTQTYREMMRMTYTDFLALLRVIEPYIAPCQIVGGNKVITAVERLTLTIRYLATGESFRSLSFQFRISSSGISYRWQTLLCNLQQMLAFTTKTTRIPTP